jgi:drug/metabolite transporter (DMT)-like permease
MSTLAIAGGVALAAGAAACFDGAVAWQALEARRAGGAAGQGRLLWRLLRRPRWVAATGLAAFGWPLQVAALSLAPLTLVQPTLAFGLVLLLGLGRAVLGERVGRLEVLGVAGIVGGVAVLAWAAPARTTATAGGWHVLAPVLALLAAAVIPWLLRTRTSGVVAMLAAGCAFACTGLGSKLLADAIARGSAGAALGWAAVTAVAGVAGMGNDMWALQRLPATRAAPVMLAMEVALPVLLAPLVVGETWGSTPGGGLGVLAGLALVLAGALPLASSAAISGLAPVPSDA